jgi:hypothetical protein
MRARIARHAIQASVTGRDDERRSRRPAGRAAPRAARAHRLQEERGYDGRQPPNSSPTSRRTAVLPAATNCSKRSGQATLPAAAPPASTKPSATHGNCSATPSDATRDTYASTTTRCGSTASSSIASAAMQRLRGRRATRASRTSTALFRGEPLAGIDALWAETERRRLTPLRADFLVRAGWLRLGPATHQGRSNWPRQRRHSMRRTSVPFSWRSKPKPRLVVARAVVERYERLRRELEERFGLEPSRDTKHLHRQLLSQDPSAR